MQSVRETFQQRALAEKRRLCCLLAGLDLDGGRPVFEAEEQRAGVLEVLKTSAEALESGVVLR